MEEAFYVDQIVVCNNESMTTIKNEQWTKIYQFLRQCPSVYAGQEADCRLFIEGAHWIMRAGVQWRELPEKYGKWNSVYKRFARWSDKDIWEKMHHYFADDPDMENLILGSAIIRAHPCAAGALKESGGQAKQVLGRSRGGFSAKVYVNVDALGNPLRFILTGGQRHDCTQAEALIDGYEYERLLADKSYDTDDILQLVAEQEAKAVIPPRANRLEQRDYDEHWYKERHLVECFINKIKHYRRIFSRFEKLAKRYLAFLSFAGTLIWLR